MTRGWLVSPAFDLLFISNVGWVAALGIGLLIAEGAAPLQFWQMYFLTTPHRWLTLVLVALDPDRREGPRFFFIGLPIFFLCAMVAVEMHFGVLLCLALIDYVWNGWHFASQHVGVLRIYGRKLGDGPVPLERHGLRAFIFYVILRTAGWSTGWLESDDLGALALSCADIAFGLLGAAVLAGELLAPAARRYPKRIYLASVAALYGILLLALSLRWNVGITVLTVASAAFHAIEYLALVTHYAWQRNAVGSPGLFRTVASYWVLLLAAYLLAIGVLDWLLRSANLGWWVGMNVWAAFLHYSYDGMIWKLRKPATAQALGAGGDA